MKVKALLLSFPLWSATLGHAAGLIVSANDQSVTYPDNTMHFASSGGRGSLTVLDLASIPAKAVTISDVPVTVIGPPTFIAAIPGTNRVLTSCAMAVEVENGTPKHAPRSDVFLVDLSQKRIVASITVGVQATGLSVSPDGRLALIANRAEGTVSSVSIEKEALREIARTQVATATDSLAHVEISPSGRFAAATLNQGHAVLLLAIDETSRPSVVQRIEFEGSPYAARFTPDENFLFVADIAKHRVQRYALLDGKATLVESLAVGRVPEGIDISPDSAWLAASCFEGANLPEPTAPAYGKSARIHLFRLNGKSSRLHDRIPVQGAPQFAVFSGDSQHLIVSNTGPRQLEIFTLRNGRFENTGHVIPLDGEPVGACRAGAQR